MGFTPRSSRLPQPCVVRNPKYERCLTVARSMSFHCQNRADKNFSAWEVEYEGAKGKDPDWPFTRKMVSSPLHCNGSKEFCRWWGRYCCLSVRSRFLKRTEVISSPISTRPCSRDSFQFMCHHRDQRRQLQAWLKPSAKAVKRQYPALLQVLITSHKRTSRQSFTDDEKCVSRLSILELHGCRCTVW